MTRWTLTESSSNSTSSPEEPSAVGGEVVRRSLTLLSALLAFAAAQLLKFILVWLKEKKWDPRRFFASGGTPSSLAATVAGLAVAIGMQEGTRGSSFAISIIFAVIVMYDASGIRFHAGRQAALLNQLVCEFALENLVSTFRPLRDSLGHTPLQVFLGAALGCAVSYLSQKSL